MTLSTIPILDIEARNLSTGKFDFLKEAAKERSMTYKKFELDSKPFFVTFKAYLTSDTIIVGNFDGNPSFSLPIQLAEDSDFELFDNLNQQLLTKIPSDEHWTVSTVVKEDNRMFLKIKYGDKKSLVPKVKSNIPINLKKPLDFPVYQGQDVDVTGQLGYYYNFDEKMCGTSFTLTALEFKE